MDKVILWEMEFLKGFVGEYFPYFKMKELFKIEYMKYQRNLLRTDKRVAFSIFYRKLSRCFKKQIREIRGLNRIDKELVEENAANFINLFQIKDSFTDMDFYQETEELNALFEPITSSGYW